MRITESQLRKIVREEAGRLLESSGTDNRSTLAVLRKWKHPSAADSVDMREFLNTASTVYYEFEERSPDGFKQEMEDGQGQPMMPIEFYADLVSAMIRDEKSYWTNKSRSAYTPGYRD